MQSLYIAGTGPGSGKSVVVLGLLEVLRSAGLKVGFFRPIVQSEDGPNPLTELIRERHGLTVDPGQMYGCAASVATEMVGNGRYDALLELVLDRFKTLERACDLVVCAGTDFDGLLPALEFDFNLDLGRNLGCAFVAVVPGFGAEPNRIADAVQVAHTSIEDRGVDLVATFVNGISSTSLEETRAVLAQRLKQPDQIHTLPSVPTLQRPTVHEVGSRLGAKVLVGSEANLEQDIAHCVVAAMQVPDFLRHLREGSLVITPGDRSDIILASLAADTSSTAPRVAGLLLTGGLVPPPSVRQLIEGLGQTNVPILSVPGDTFVTAIAVADVEPKLPPTDERKVAAAIGVFESQVDVEALRKSIQVERSPKVTPLMFEYELLQRAKRDRKRIVLPEGTDERILRAAELLALREAADLILLGDERVAQYIKTMGLRIPNLTIIDPVRSELRSEFADVYAALRAHKGTSRELAWDVVADPSYFGTLMVHLGYADGMVSGAAHTTQHTIRPAFQIVKTRPTVDLVSSVFFMCLPDRVLVYGDCAVNPNPDEKALADIASASADTAAQFGLTPRVAMLSYSSGTSGKGADVERVREATALIQARRPDLLVDGPMQYDAAVDMNVARSKLPGSPVAGQATVLVFPDLNTGNNTYKAVQRTAGAIAIGPILQGLNKPINDLSRGCTVTDIVNTVAITAVQAGVEPPKETS